jgi:23S rRNA pseudouridine1911/1915/1917 synthase
MKTECLQIDAASAGQTLAAIVRSVRPSTSWSQSRQLVAARRVRLNGELCLDPARRLKESDVVEILPKPDRLPANMSADLVIRHLDDHIVVVEKPAGLSTTRHPAERDWSHRRRALSPTLEDRLQLAIAAKLRKPLTKLPRLRKVHRLDKLTSGLLVFARSALAERELGRQFHAHTVDRRYQALVPGRLKPQTVRSYLIRDRGDGRRGSISPLPASGRGGRGERSGKLAVTHIEKVEPLSQYSLVTCRLETGRTHQIRIHLADLGHPVCGDPVYSIRPDGNRIPDNSAVPRLSLHAAELGFKHPATGEQLHWSMPLPQDLTILVNHLSKSAVSQNVQRPFGDRSK